MIIKYTCIVLSKPTPKKINSRKSFHLFNHVQYDHYIYHVFDNSYVKERIRCSPKRHFSVSKIKNISTNIKKIKTNIVLV